MNGGTHGLNELNIKKLFTCHLLHCRLTVYLGGKNYFKANQYGKVTLTFSCVIFFLTNSFSGRDFQNAISKRLF